MIKDSVYIQGLIDYIKDVKPFSSKLLDVAIEYLFDDSFAVSVKDSHSIKAELGSVWTNEFSYDGKTLKYQIPVGSLADDIFISFSNFNDTGVLTPNAIGAVYNSNTRFVPYKKTLQIADGSGGGSGPDPSSTWGGSYDIDPNAPSNVPPDAEDPTDYLNGIPNFDVLQWDGLGNEQSYAIIEFVDDTRTVKNYYTDAYGYTQPVVSILAGRAGVLIGSLTRKTASTGAFYYVFEFNKAYLDVFVPVGTIVKIVVSQKNAMSGSVSAHFAEQFTWGLQEAVSDTMYLKQQSSIDSVAGIYDDSAYDISPYDTPYDPLLLASSVHEQLTIKVEPTDNSEKLEIISSSIPDVKSGFAITQDVSNVTKVIVNHFFGDTNPSGPYASQGGVIVDVMGATPTSVSNPYLSNVPQLFNTTVIEFSEPVTATIRVTKP